MKKNYTAATLKHLISSLRAIVLYQISGNAIPQLPWTPEALCGGNDTRGFVPVSSCCVCLFVKSSLQCIPVSDILILGLMTTNNYPDNWEGADTDGSGTFLGKVDLFLTVWLSDSIHHQRVSFCVPPHPLVRMQVCGWEGGKWRVAGSPWAFWCTWHEGPGAVSGALRWALPQARHSHSSRDFHTPMVESSSGPPLLTISSGLGERVNGRGRAPGGRLSGGFHNWHPQMTVRGGGASNQLLV